MTNPPAITDAVVAAHVAAWSDDQEPQHVYELRRGIWARASCLHREADAARGAADAHEAILGGRSVAAFHARQRADELDARAELLEQAEQALGRYAEAIR